MADRTRRLAATSLVVGLLAAGLAVALGSTDRSAALLARGTTDWISVAQTAGGEPIANESARQVATDADTERRRRLGLHDLPGRHPDRGRHARLRLPEVTGRLSPPGPSWRPG
jgi:hypothetical protein